MLTVLYAILTPLSALKRLLSAFWDWVTQSPARIVIALLTLLCAFLCWRLASVDGDRDKWRSLAREYEAASKIVREADKAADAIGTKVAEQSKGEVDAQVERAREAAKDSGDPLDALSRSLRGEDRNGKH